MRTEEEIRNMIGMYQYDIRVKEAQSYGSDVHINAVKDAIVSGLKNVVKILEWVLNEQKEREV